MELLCTLLIPIFAVTMVVVVSRSVASHSFRCDHCHKEFHIKWTRVLFTEHSEKDYRLTCPHCNTKDWCRELDK